MLKKKLPDPAPHPPPMTIGCEIFANPPPFPAINNKRSLS